MSDDRKPSVVPWIAGVVMLGLDVGAYYGMVERLVDH